MKQARIAMSSIRNRGSGSGGSYYFKNINDDERQRERVDERDLKSFFVTNIIVYY